MKFAIVAVAILLEAKPMKKMMKLVYFSCLMFSCGNPERDQARLQYDSFHSVALDGVIAAGRLYTDEADDAEVPAMIRQQLQYTVGFLNGYNSVGDVARTTPGSIKILSRRELAPGEFEVTYEAKLTVSWPRQRAIPASLELILPARFDAARTTEAEFFRRYAVAACLDPATHDLGLYNFWYYIRPLQPGCPLSVVDEEVPLSLRTTISLSLSATNTEGKRPEYRKVWEDGRLNITAVFSKESAGGGEDDAGVAQYNAFFFELIRLFGNPTYLTPRIPRTGPGVETPEYSVSFRSRRGPIHLHVALVSQMAGNGRNFESRFKQATAASDLVMYHGHAGLGANVRSMSQLAGVTPSKYQVYFLNGCDTYAYLDDSLAERHLGANPGAGKYKFVDVIVNAMPSYFSHNSYNASYMLASFVNASLTYRGILQGLPQVQYASVIGEEDND